MTIILNFKTYEESLGDNAIKCAEAAYNFSKKTKNRIIICPQIVDIENILEKVEQTDNFQVWAQHVDFENGEKETGFITVDTLKALNIKGSLINHAEHKIKDLSVYVGIEKKIEICLCTSNMLELGVILSKNPHFEPQFIAYEPPQLIGGNVSVATADPDNVERIVEKYYGYNILVGAGIKTNEDMKIIKKLGAKGILIASNFVMAKDKEKFLYELTMGI